MESIDNFEIFKRMMVKKNADLNREAIEMLQAQQESASLAGESTTPQKPPSPKASETSEEPSTGSRKEQL